MSATASRLPSTCCRWTASEMFLAASVKTVARPEYTTYGCTMPKRPRHVRHGLTTDERKADLVQVSVLLVNANERLILESKKRALRHRPEYAAWPPVGNSTCAVADSVEDGGIEPPTLGLQSRCSPAE